MLTNPPTITDQANALGSLLDEWAKPRGGSAKVMANIRHLWEELFVVSDSPRLLVVCEGEQARGGFDNANTLHRVDRQWTVVIVRGHGFLNLVADSAREAEPFLTSVETVRDIIRCIIGLSEEFPIDYKGFKPLPNIGGSPGVNVFMDAYAIDFSTANDIPAVEADNI
jgi:hypothetical protein